MTNHQPSIDARGFSHLASLEHERSHIKSKNFYCDLSHIGFIRATGDDTKDFLQAQLTNDLTKLTEHNHQLHGLCNPKGRLLSTVNISYLTDGLLLQLPQSLLDNVRHYISRYILRARVRLSEAEDMHSIGVSGGAAAESLEATCGSLPESPGDCRHTDDYSVLAHPGAEPRYQVIGSSHLISDLKRKMARCFPPVGSWVWALLDISNGIPTIYPESQGEFVPQMANLDLIGGVDFKKGCYPGQEIVARMHYLGKLKQRMLRGHIDVDDVPDPGANVFMQGRSQSAGKIVDAQSGAYSGVDLLAVVRLGGLDESTLHVVSPDGPELRRLDLPYSIE